MKIKTKLYACTEHLCLFVLICCMLLSSFTVKGELSSQDVSSRLLRLHVIAQSDSQQDQTLKLKVRDGILKESKSLFENVSDIKTAEKLCRNNLEKLESIAQSIIKSEGFSYDAKVFLDNELYPVRQYEEFTLPAGEYLSLRIVLGEGKGKNWWCVMYPPLCTSYASRTVSSDKYLLSEHGFSDKEINILCEGSTDETGKVVLRSRILDFFIK